jgi:anti-anti-sigma factor
MSHLPETGASAGRLSIRRWEVDGTRQLAVSGELDLAAAPELRDACSVPAQPDQHTVVLDLAGVTFIDSSGIHALVGAYEIHSERLRIVASPAVARMIDLCGLSAYLPIEPIEV